MTSSTPVMTGTRPLPRRWTRTMCRVLHDTSANAKEGSYEGGGSGGRRRGKHYIRLKLNYFLGREKTRAKVKECSILMPRHHELDHRLVVTRLHMGSSQKLRPYCRRWHRFPVKLPQSLALEVALRHFLRSCRPL